MGHMRYWLVFTDNEDNLFNRNNSKTNTYKSIKASLQKLKYVTMLYNDSVIYC